ncbi:MAG: L-histidine N(alpha)-methyltransferase, partial [Gemmatimonadota bacterium]|nr:L-histidine N(alpha)-methyltransferase [Gemmatimonadota bacterium]
MVASVSPDAPDEEVESIIVAPQAAVEARTEFAKAVALGLSDTPPWLPSRFIYDGEGSRLFEEICKQPEYYLTNCEAGILRKNSGKI